MTLHLEQHFQTLVILASLIGTFLDRVVTINLVVRVWSLLRDNIFRYFYTSPLHLSDWLIDIFRQRYSPHLLQPIYRSILGTLAPSSIPNDSKQPLGFPLICCWLWWRSQSGNSTSMHTQILLPIHILYRHTSNSTSMHTQILLLIHSPYRYTCWGKVDWCTLLHEPSQIMTRWLEY